MKLRVVSAMEAVFNLPHVYCCTPLFTVLEVFILVGGAYMALEACKVFESECVTAEELTNQLVDFRARI